MDMQRRPWALVIGLLTVCMVAPAVAQAPRHAGGCDTYEMDVSAETTLLGKPRAAIAAAAASDAPIPILAIGKAYTLKLNPQADVRFVAPPARRMLPEGAYAGMARFTVNVPGTWRISLGYNSWVDVVAADGSFAQSSRFTGHDDCAELRKLVEFPLKPGIDYTLQLSGGTRAAAPVLVTGPIENSPVDDTGAAPASDHH